MWVNFQPIGETINAAQQCGTVNELREVVLQKRPGKMKDRVIMLHDKVTSHTDWQTQQMFQWYGWEMLQHPAHSPTLAFSNFHLSEPLKQHLLGQQFENDDVIVAVMTWLQALEQDLFVKGFNALVSC
jgi:hypothetical protein